MNSVLLSSLGLIVISGFGHAQLDNETHGLSWDEFVSITEIILDDESKSCWLAGSPLLTETHRAWSVPTHAAIRRKDKKGYLTEFTTFMLLMDCELGGPCFQRLDIDQMEQKMDLLHELPYTRPRCSQTSRRICSRSGSSRGSTAPESPLLRRFR